MKDIEQHSLVDEAKSLKKKNGDMTLMTLRVSQHDLGLMKDGAAKDNMSLSAWIRSLSARRIEEQSMGIDSSVDSSLFPLVRALRNFITEEVDRRTNK